MNSISPLVGNAKPAHTIDVVVVAGIPPDTAQLKVELEPSGTSTVFPDSPVKSSPLIVRTGSFEEGSEIIEFSAATFYI